MTRKIELLRIIIVLISVLIFFIYMVTRIVQSNYGLSSIIPIILLSIVCGSLIIMNIIPSIPPFGYSKHLKRKEYDKAIRLCEKKLEKNSKNKKALTRLAEAYLESKQYDKSIEVYNRLADIDTKLKFHWYCQIGKLYSVKEEYYKALEMVNSALKIDTDYYMALILRNEILLDIGQYDECIKINKNFIEINKHSQKPVWYYYLSQGHQKKGEYDKALEAVDNALKIDPLSSESKNLRELILKELKK